MWGNVIVWRKLFFIKNNQILAQILQNFLRGKMTDLELKQLKDNQPLAIVKSAIEVSLNNDLPMIYDKESFQSKTNLLMNHFIDMAVQGYGWVTAPM